MDQTDFSLLVGLIIGWPIADLGVSLAAPSLPWWASGLAAVPLGLLPVAAVAYASVGYIGRRQERLKSENKDA